MYSIEHYKTKKKKPEIYVTGHIELRGTPQRKILILRANKLKNDYINTCFDVKSLTVDLSDLYNIVYDNDATCRSYLLGLYAEVRRLDLDSDINSIKILKNNRLNEHLIYGIMKCDWMVNRDAKIDNFDELIENAESKKEILLQKHQRYDFVDENDFSVTLHNRLIRNSIEDKIHLLDYYMESLDKLQNGELEEQKSLKLGVKFFK